MHRYKLALCDEAWSLYQWLFLFIPGRLGHRLRGAALKPFFKQAGKNISVKENVEIYRPWNLTIGTGSGFGRNNIIDCTGGIIIGNNVRFGPNVMVATMNHSTIKDGMEDKVRKLRVVEIGDNVWIGHGSTILPGVKVGSNVIIAAGAVVNKDVDSNSAVGGVPARKLG
ncbi:acyltransferase [Halomonas litopenaei]|nr:acyltransferase [Halomonas litopenaei]MBN8410993.1 acyltransferase [Halomonas litopenaei]